jgi:hypothetical protein
MAHFAKIDNNNIVTEVIVAEQNFINSGSVGDSFLWIQTSYNDNFRKQFAGVGCTYDKDKDVFIRPQTYPSWELDNNNDWVAPVAYPLDGATEINRDATKYDWDEETTNWIEVTGE